MNVNDIRSVGNLNNRDGSIALTICLRGQVQPVYVSVSPAEFEAAGGRVGLNNNKQQVVDFYNQYGPGRTR